MNDKQRDALARRIEQDIQISRKNGTTARDLYMPNAAGVARALTFVLGENYTFAEMERALGAEMTAFPSVLLEKNWEAETNAKRVSEPTKDEMRTWSAEKKLAYSNQQTLERIEKADAEARQKEVTDHDFDSSKPLTPAERLEVANGWKHEASEAERKRAEGNNPPGSPAQRMAIAAAWKALGVDLNELERSAPSLDRTKKAQTAMQRLSAANEAALAAATAKGKKP